MSDDLSGRAREIDEKLPKAPWGVGEVSASQADIVDAKGNWIGTVRKDFDEDSEDKPLIVELRNMLPELLEAFAQMKPADDKPFFTGQQHPTSPTCPHGHEQRWCNKQRADGRLCADVQAEVDLGLAKGSNNISAPFTQPPTATARSAGAAALYEIEKWSRWSLQSDITTDGQTLKNAIGHVATLLLIVYRQSAEIAGMAEIVETSGRESVRDVKEAVRQRDEARADLTRSIAVTDEKIAEGDQWRDKWRKASAEGVADRMEIERLQNALEAAERKLADLGSELTIAGTMIVRVREEANQQRARAETAEAALSENKCWQFEQPTPGRWRMKFLRGCGYEIMECEVTPFQTESSDLIVILPGQWANSSLPINDEFFINAQWQRVE